MGMVCAAFVVIGVIEVAGRDRPVYWGTFTETSMTCDRRPKDICTSTGRWVSDDGTITKDAVTLDGSLERGHPVRASYQPGGAMATTRTPSCTRPPSPRPAFGCLGC